MILRFLTGISLLAGIAVSQPAIPPDSTDQTSLLDSMALSSAALPKNTLRRWPVRTIEDWLALHPEIAVRYPGSKNIHYRGARDYSNSFVRFGLQIEDPLTGFKLGTFSPFAYHDLWIRPASAFNPNPALGGTIAIQSPDYRRTWSGSIEITSDHFTGDYDQNWYDFALRSPRFMNGTMVLDLVSERRYHGDRQPSPIADQVTPGGGEALPGNSLDGWSHHVSVLWHAGRETTVRFWGDFLRDDYRTYDHSFYYYPEHMPRTVDQFADVGVSMKRSLSSRSRLTLAASVSEHKRTHGDGVVFDDIDAYYRGIDNPGYDTSVYYGLFRGEDSLGNAPYYNLFFTQRARRIQLAGELATNFSRHHVSEFHFLLTLTHASLTDRYRNKSAAAVIAGYTDMYQFGNLNVVGAIDLQGQMLDAPRYVSTGYYDGVNPGTPQQDPSGSSNGEGSRILGSVSPRVQITCDLGKLRLRSRAGYVHELPPLQIMFAGAAPEWKVAWEKVLYGSAGLDYAIGSWMNASVDGYYRFYDDLSLGQVASTIAWSGVPDSYRTPFAVYYPDRRTRSYGATVSVTMQPSAQLSVHAAYTASKTKGTVRDVGFHLPGALPYHYGYADYRPSAHDQPHKLVATLDWHTKDTFQYAPLGLGIFRNLSAVATIYAASGFTFLPDRYAQTDRTRQPAVYQVDLKIEKGISIEGMTVTPFFWVRNLFDHQNAAYVYSVTGEPDDAGYLNTPEGQARAASDPAFIDQYELYQHNPSHYAPPRQIYLGLRAEF